MNEPDRSVSLHSEVYRGGKILRVPKGFGNSEREDWWAAEDEQEILELFRINGFEIAEGMVNLNNPCEIAISSNEDFNLNRHIRERQIAKVVGIESPSLYKPKEMVSTNKPVVAKDPNADRGENKYLLETSEQKIRFLAWSIFAGKIKWDMTLKDANCVLQNTLRNVTNGHYEDPTENSQRFLNRWLFEEYIETPGEYYTSFRIVSDALGTVHYGQAARSEEKKDSALMAHLSIQEDPLSHAIEYNPNILLLHPESPLYIAPKKFTSNIMTGGKPLLLNGVTILDEADRQTLRDLDINPDSPKIPEVLIGVSSKIGRIFRTHFPYVGIDFLLRSKDKIFVLLELNKYPGLRPEALGLPNGALPQDCMVQMMQKIIDNIRVRLN